MAARGRIFFDSSALLRYMHLSFIGARIVKNIEILEESIRKVVPVDDRQRENLSQSGWRFEISEGSKHLKAQYIRRRL